MTTSVWMLVLGILALQIVIWIPVILWMRRRQAARTEALRAELASSGERVVREPEPAVFRGGTGEGRTRVRGNCVVALSDRRLVYRLLVGEGGEVRRDAIESVREEAWFLGGRTGQMHVVVRLVDGGEVGFYFRDRAAWQSALREPAR